MRPGRWSARSPWPPGVVVHVHDVFLPFNDLRSFALQKRFFSTEQYLLQAFLAFNRSFEVLATASWLQATHPDVLREAIPSWTAGRVPGSFWLRRTR